MDRRNSENNKFAPLVIDITDISDNSDEGYSEQNILSRAYHHPLLNIKRLRDSSAFPSISDLPENLLNLTENERADLALRLLLTISTNNLISINDRITPLLHRDFLTELPDELATNILKFLDYKSLLASGKVSRRWEKLCGDQKLWKDLFLNSGWFYNKESIATFLKTNWDGLSNVYNARLIENQQASSNMLGVDMGEANSSNLNSPINFFQNIQHNVPGSSNLLETTSTSFPTPPQIITDLNSNNQSVEELNVLAQRLNLETNSQAPTILSPRPINLPVHFGSPRPTPTLSRERRTPTQLTLIPATTHGPTSPSSPMMSEFRDTPNITSSMFTVPRHRNQRLHRDINGRFSPIGSPLFPNHGLNLGNNREPRTPTIVSPGIRPEVDSPALLMTPLFEQQMIDEGSDDSSLESIPGPDESLPFRKNFLQKCFKLHFKDSRPFVDWKHLYMQRLNLENNWREKSFKTLPLVGHQDGVYCLQFDEYKAISGSRDNTIKIWDLEKRTCIRTYSGHSKSVLCLQYNKDIIVSGSSDTNILVWNLYTGEIIHRLTGHEDSVLGVRIDDKHIVSCSKDRTIKVWCLKTGELLRTLLGHQVAVNAIQFLGNTIISASGDRTMKMWDLETGACLRTYVGHSRGIACVQYNGKYIYSGSSDNTIRIWDANTGECLHTLTGHTELVRALELSPDGKKLISGSYDHTIKIWDLTTYKKTLELNPGQQNWVFNVRVSNTKVLSCSQANKILIFDFSNNVDTTFLE